MEAHLEREERKKLISECLKWEIELKKLKKRCRVKKKRNLKVQRHNKVLSNELVVLRKPVLKNDDYQQVIADCHVVLRNGENLKKLNTADQQTSKNNVNVAADRRFKCQHSGCEKNYAKKDELYKHIVIHTNRFQCKVCQKCFHSQSHLKRHLRIHTGERPFKCDWAGCGKKFKQEGQLKAHKIKHSDVRSFQCKEEGCGKRFKTKNVLKQHVNCHSSIRFYNCQVEGCDKRFKSKGGLKNHVRFVHDKERPFKCDQNGCGKLFPNQTELSQHIKIHLSYRPFHCQECDNFFKLKSNFKKHLKEVHFDVKKFRCDFQNCFKTYSTRSNLKQHQKIHL